MRILAGILLIIGAACQSWTLVGIAGGALIISGIVSDIFKAFIITDYFK